MPKKTTELNHRSEAALTASIIRRLEEISNKEGKFLTDVYRDWVLGMACALSFGSREEDFNQMAGHYKCNVQEVFGQLMGELVVAMEHHPYRDVLGPLHMELGNKRAMQATGEFYTPNDVCRFMAGLSINIEGLLDDEPHVITVQEPACGAGGMILAMAGHLVDEGLSPLNMQVQAIDILSMACDMCFVQTTLWNIPCQVVHGNSLTMEFHSIRDNIFYTQAEPFDRSVVFTRKITRAIRSIGQITRTNIPDDTPTATETVMAEVVKTDNVQVETISDETLNQTTIELSPGVARAVPIQISFPFE